MSLKSKLLSLSTAASLLFAHSSSAETSLSKIPLPPTKLEQKEASLPTPFQFAEHTSKADQKLLTSFVSQALKDPITAQHFSEVKPFARRIVLKLIPPFESNTNVSFRGALIILPEKETSQEAGISIVPKRSEKETVDSLKEAISGISSVFKEYQENQLSKQQPPYAWQKQKPINPIEFQKAKEKDPRLANVSLLKGTSPGVELKHEQFLYRVRLEKINGKQSFDGEIPILSFRVASVQNPFIERPMTEKDLKNIKKPIIEAIRGGQDLGFLPKKIEGSPLINSALRFDTLLSKLINRVFSNSEEYQTVFNTSDAIYQTNVRSFLPCIIETSPQKKLSEQCVGFAFCVGNTYFNATTITGFSITQNNVKRSMNAQEMAFFKKTVQQQMTPDIREKSDSFWKYFDRFSEPHTTTTVLVAHVITKKSR